MNISLTLSISAKCISDVIKTLSKLKQSKNTFKKSY